MENGYEIHVGHHSPEKVIVSAPTKDGNPSPEFYEAMAQVGVFNLINRTRVWARRVLPNGKPKTDEKGVEIVLEVTDKDYKGNLEFLKYGDPKVGAQMIDTRYLPQSLSLDVQYQDNVQKIVTVFDNKDESLFIQLTNGRNQFDPKTEALLIQHLKVHGQNRDSKSKNNNPTIKGWTFFEVNETSTDHTFIREEESKLATGNFIKAVSNVPGALKNLLEVLLEKGANFEELGIQNMTLLAGETEIYKGFLKYVQQKAGDFAQYVEMYKKDISDLFQKATSYEVLDKTKKGFVSVIVDNKPQIIYQNEEIKGDMSQWVLENCFSSAVYERSKHFKVVLDNLK